MFRIYSQAGVYGILYDEEVHNRNIRQTHIFLAGEEFIAEKTGG